MTSLPFVIEEQARGIVIRTADTSRTRPVRVWAYMWAADEDDQPIHWHERVPVEHAA